MKVGILTSGGDCQSLNATMRGLAITLYNNIKDVEIIGFLYGYKGLMYEDYKIMKPEDFSDIINIINDCFDFISRVFHEERIYCSHK